MKLIDHIKNIKKKIVNVYHLLQNMNKSINYSYSYLQLILLANYWYLIGSSELFQ